LRREKTEPLLRGKEGNCAKFKEKGVATHGRKFLLTNKTVVFGGGAVEFLQTKRSWKKRGKKVAPVGKRKGGGRETKVVLRVSPNGRRAVREGGGRIRREAL